MSDSDSPLSSPPPSGDELTPEFDVRPVLAASKKNRVKAQAKGPSKKKATPGKKSQTGGVRIKLKAKPRSPSPPPKRPKRKEPPHEYTFADSPELAFIVAFRSRFSDAFKGLPVFGPQDLETGVTENPPSELVDLLLCRLISLVLNRKKPVERGHYQRALEEVVHANISVWPSVWGRRNPLHGGNRFETMDAQQRLTLLKALTNWALVSSEEIRAAIAVSYRFSRREDDSNVTVAVHPIGRDGEKRNYFLMEGNDDAPFRIYQEGNLALKNVQWINVAGSIDEVRKLAADLAEFDGTKHAMKLRTLLLNECPRLEDNENKRRKREYRMSRKAFFANTTGVSLYEGRTRGKRIKYTFSDDEGDTGGNSRTTDPDANTRKSAHVSPQPEMPRYTASGRQIRKPNQGAYGETLINGSAGVTGANTSRETSEVAMSPGTLDGHDTEDEAKSTDVDDEMEWDANSTQAGDEEEESDESAPSEWDDSGYMENGDIKMKSMRIVLKVNPEKNKPPPATTDSGVASSEGTANGVGSRNEAMDEEKQVNGTVPVNGVNGSHESSKENENAQLEVREDEMPLAAQPNGIAA